MPEKVPGGAALTPPSLEGWWEQHSQLDRLVAALDANLGRRAALDAALESLDELREALEAHLLIEEGLYFPLVRRLAPETGEMIREAQHGHNGLREALARLGRRIEAGDLAAARSALDQTLDGFQLHEELERRLIDSIAAIGTH